MKTLLFTLILLVNLSACTKQETVTTFGQQVVTKIQGDLKSYSVTSSLVHIGTTYMTGSAAIFFDGQIMIIDSNHYNLNQLIEYHVTKGQNGYYIEFYF